MNDVDFPVADVLDGIDAASEAGFESVKINTVVKRGVNDDQVEAMASRFRGDGRTLRFIEFMDVGGVEPLDVRRGCPERGTRPSHRSLVPRSSRSSRPTPARSPNAGAIGTAPARSDSSPASRQPFCRDCSRARLSPEGRLYTCLFAGQGTDLRRGCAPRRATTTWPGPSAPCGRDAPTAIRSCAARLRRRLRRRSKCPTSAVDDSALLRRNYRANLSRCES